MSPDQVKDRVAQESASLHNSRIPAPTTITAIEARVEEEVKTAGGTRASSAIALDPPQPDQTNDFRVKPPKPCEGCGGPAHGSATQGYNCVRDRMREARVALGQKGPFACDGCGKSHAHFDQVVACMRGALKRAREREGIGVSRAQFEENRRSSEHFERTRGKGKAL